MSEEKYEIFKETLVGEDKWFEVNISENQARRFKVTNNLCRQKILEMLSEVLIDIMQVFDFGAKKHPDSGDTPNFLTPEGNKCELKVRGKSVLGHAASSFCNPGALDDESNLSHLLHLMASAAILYIRNKRNIVHPDDKE